jgi:para-nitrobenzyl esterase
MVKPKIKERLKQITMNHKKIITTVIVSAALVLLTEGFSFKQNNIEAFERVKVDGGIISGTINTACDIHIFKGIPFAATPVGNLRWKEPQPVIPWKGLKECIAFGASPMQGSPIPFGPWSAEYLIPKKPISEDCLYLNVWTGAASPKEKRPVIVWIYGGGFMSGGAGCEIYHEEAMAKKGIIFVSINYRVGIFGFFAHPELTKESIHHASGNYGLMDQIAALQWVRKNIAAFGGDPNNVTIAGQSAGSMSVNCLVASPLCKRLFKHAIAESGASFLKGVFTGMPTLKQAEDAGLKTGASLTDLRKMPATELMKKEQSIRGVIIDLYVLPQSIAELFAAGKQNDVDLLTGWNEDDGVQFGNLKTAEEFKKQVEQQYGNDAGTFLKLYPAATDDEAAAAQAHIARDMTFGIQNYTWANIQAENSKHKVYLYHFTRRLPATGDYVKYGAFHTGEVAYAYDNLAFVHRCPWEPVDHELATVMSTYWANFAKTGNPNGPGFPEWPAYNTRDYTTMILGETQIAKPLPGKAGLDFLLARMK